MTNSRDRRAPQCALDPVVPGCDTGPLGRLGFVVREVRTALRARRGARAARDTSAGIAVDPLARRDRSSHRGMR